MEKWYIYPHGNHKNPPNLGEYTSPMDGMGWILHQRVSKFHNNLSVFFTTKSPSWSNRMIWVHGVSQNVSRPWVNRPQKMICLEVSLRFVISSVIGIYFMPRTHLTCFCWGLTFHFMDQIFQNMGHLGFWNASWPCFSRNMRTISMGVVVGNMWHSESLLHLEHQEIYVGNGISLMVARLIVVSFFPAGKLLHIGSNYDILAHMTRWFFTTNVGKYIIHGS